MKYTECLLDSILMIGYDMLVAGAEVGRVEKQRFCGMAMLSNRFCGSG